MPTERIERLKSFYFQEPNNLQLLNDLITLYYNENYLEELIEFAIEIEDSILSDAQVAYRVGMACLTIGKYQFAEKCFYFCNKSYPENTATAYNYAFSKYALHQFEQSLEIINSVEKKWHDTPELKLLAARCFHQTQNLELALEAITKFIQIKPDSLEAIGLKSLILLDSGSYKEAEELSKQVLDSDENLLEPIIAMVSSLIAQGNYEQAQGWVEKGIDKHPKVGRIWQSKGQLEMLNMQFERAESSLKTSINNMSNHIGTWHLLAWTQLILDKTDSARGSFNSALKLDRNFADSHGAIAMMDVLSGDIKQAEENVKRALKLDPRCATGLYAKSLILERQGDNQRAKLIIDKIFSSAEGKNALIQLPQIRQKFEGNQRGI